MNDQITELKRLLAEATPGPWDRDGHILSRPRNGNVLPGQWLVETKYIVDSALIVALRNSAPALLARLADLERLHKAIKQIHPSGLTIDVQEALAKLTLKEKP